jgi:hypothetical protein
MELGNRSNIVIHDKKFIFMMLKKCGSVTMGMTILSSLGHTDLGGNNVNKVLGSETEHLDKYEVDKLKDYTKVVWVRNPYNRLVSGWFDRIHLIRNEDTMSWYGVPNTITFPDFIDWVCSIPDEEMNVHFKQQTDDITIDGRLVPNVVMKLENLTEEWKQLRSRFNWLSELKYHANKSKKGDYRSYYTDELVEKVKIRFKDDLYLLNYTFEGK